MVVLLLLAAVGIGLQQLNAGLAIHSWRVYCDDAQLQQSLLQRLQQMAPLGFVQGDPSRVAQQLRQLEPDVAAIEVKRILPSRLTVHAQVRQPIALWTGGRGKVMLVDGAGEVYRALRHGEQLDLPLLRVSDRRQVIAIARLLGHLQQQSPQRMALMSEMIAYDGLLRINFARGAQWQVPLDTNVVSCVDHILALLNKQQWRHGSWRVDARQKDRWFVRAGNGNREVI